MTDHDSRYRALLTGVTGQDGWYLARRLLAEGQEVHGIVRDAAVIDAIAAELPGLQVHLADLRDHDSLLRALEAAAPDRIFNLAGSTSVARSWEEPVETADTIGIGAVRLLAAAWERQERTGSEIRFLQASSAEVFGDPATAPQSEATLRNPVTPYGAAKDFAHTMVQVYRHRGLYATAAILYNHESPRRPPTFVARKITAAVAAIARGRADHLSLGNMDVLRDWGYAPDYVAAMIRILDAPSPRDYVVATGNAHSVRDFVREAFAVVGIDDWESYVSVDPGLYRPADPRALVGDSTRLRELGWEPTVSFSELVRTMVQADLDELDRAATEGEVRA
ncbi:GDP-mannose 4,6-dehydratase [Nocardioides sp. LMS-CY]|uniref:GDP-mannose 4,6-dehydratase n=1 Tax=Nocardioides sp. (strain LMS-CY) TaxID=2840457 RepID=UPI00207AE4FE|nr:GDP-mannose 4,6-dehydratase [Nocardioides sp. LMS-CY]